MQACYRKLRKYKYQLVKDYEVVIPIMGISTVSRFIGLHENGLLAIKNGYCWDGPSGPTIDTLSFIRGSLIHDALYQLIRMSLLDVTFRDRTDRILQQICIEDGMWKVRAWYVYWSVKIFSVNAAAPGTQKPDKIFRVPVLRKHKRSSGK